jgi:enterochelin esterase family protein
MLRRVSALLLLCALSAVPGLAQTPAPGAGRGGRGGRGPAVVSPEVGADRTITFRYVAPNAEKVTVSGELDGQTHAMTKDANGVWTATVGPFAPDIYTYAFNVDGVVALDPRNANTKLGFGGFGAVSVVEVTGDGPAFYDVRPVPHGRVSIVPYESKAMGVARTVWVYTPPGYDQGRNYPVLYLFHGAGDVESGWTLIGHANNILDNLIADGKAKPMVVVMPLGQTMQSYLAGPGTRVSAGGRGAGPANDPGALSLFAQDLLNDVKPLIEKSYKVSTRPDDRAIAGLSMGGGQTMNIAFNRPELFRYVVLMSPAAGQNPAQTYASFFKDAGVSNKQFKVFWIGVGKDDTLVGPSVKGLDQALTTAGIHHTFVLGDGRHEWTVWRHQLNDVAPMLFK